MAIVFSHAVWKCIFLDDDFEFEEEIILDFLIGKQYL